MSQPFSPQMIGFRRPKSPCHGGYLSRNGSPYRTSGFQRFARTEEGTHFALRRSASQGEVPSGQVRIARRLCAESATGPGWSARLGTAHPRRAWFGSSPTADGSRPALARPRAARCSYSVCNVRSASDPLTLEECPMSATNWFRRVKNPYFHHRTRSRRTFRHRPQLELLEQRLAPTASASLN